eukprot:15481936-Alexandrium_andersonii.AAC.1
MVDPRLGDGVGVSDGFVVGIVKCGEGLWLEGASVGVAGSQRGAIGEGLDATVLVSGDKGVEG